jgi:hypothetical protein
MQSDHNVSNVKPQAVSPLTRAERTDYAETSHYEDVTGFLDSLVARDAPITVTFPATTTEGRAIPFVIASRPPVSTPEEARALGRPIVYVQANIHAGEVEGKEALLALLRDLSFDPSPNPLDSLVILAVPDYNADGNEKFAPQRRNRREQNGPELVGTRANAQSFDLNRDYMKAEAPETRMFLEQFTRWDADVFVDLHTTDGSYHGYALTYSPSLSPAAVFAGTYTRDSLLPELRSRMRERDGFEVFDYGNFVDNDSIEQGWFTYEAYPRYGTNYVGLKNRVSILSEAYSHDPFERRVASTYAFTREILSLAAERAGELQALRARADSSVQAWAADPANAPEISLRSEMTRTPIKMPVIARHMTKTGDTLRHEAGLPPGLESGEPYTVTIPVYDRFTSTLSRKLPVSYLIPAGDTATARMLGVHGVKYDKLSSDWSGQVQVFEIDSISRARRRYQGHSAVSLEGHWTESRRTLPAGTLVVGAGQAAGMVAFYLLEPQSDDGLVTWNFMDSAMSVSGDYPIFRYVGAPAAGPGGAK